MCHFITLIAPTNDADAVLAAMKKHGRAAGAIDNPSVRRVLRDDECQYLTTSRHCDCGTVLARHQDTPEELDEKLAKEEQRMKRKGWSAAKIARAMEDRRKADARPSGGGSDNIELWYAILDDLKSELKLPYVGLLVRSYFGAIHTETFNASRREVPKTMPWTDALSSLEQDEVTIFS